MAAADFHRQDHYYLRSFGADVASEELYQEYEDIRDCWESKGGNRGELPQATLLALAIKYKVGWKEKLKAQITEAKEIGSGARPIKKKKRGRPPKRKVHNISV